MIFKSEAQLQAYCFQWFHNTNPKKRGRLFSTFQEVSNKIEGSTKKAKGLVAGVSDFILSDEEFRIIGIEMKLPETSHDVEHLKQQAKWLLNCTYKGYFCDSFEMFVKIINGGEGISPQKVLDRLENVKTKTIVWRM